VSFVPSQRLQSVNPDGTEAVNMVSKRSARLFSKVLFERLCTNVPTSRKSGNWPVYDAGDVDGDELGFDSVHEQSTTDSGASATVRAAAANASTAGVGSATATGTTAGAATAAAAGGAAAGTTSGMSKSDSTVTLPAGAADRRSNRNSSSRSTASSSGNNSSNSGDAETGTGATTALPLQHSKPRYMSAAQTARLAAVAADPCTPPLLPTLDAQQHQLQAQLQQLQLSPGSVEAGLRLPAPFSTAGATAAAAAGGVSGATVAANGDVIGTVPLTGNTVAAAGSTTQQVRLTSESSILQWYILYAVHCCCG
jgi:hypothetical protein